MSANFKPASDPYYGNSTIIMPPTTIQPMRATTLRTPKNLWSSGLCGCCSNMSECCFAYFCPLIYQCKLYSQANEPCCACLCGGLVPLRTKIRTERNIEGNICKDFFAVAFCPFCSMVQIGTEMANTLPLIQ